MRVSCFDDTVCSSRFIEKIVKIRSMVGCGIVVNGCSTFC